MDINQIKQEIMEAFKGVTLSDGIGLWEAQAIDDYQTREVQLAARKKDEKESWQAITKSDLFNCESSLSFFDAKGMLFHIPAFILAEINGESNCGSIYHLSQMVITNPELFALFDGRQKKAVTLFLEWCVLQPQYEFEKPHIQRAIHEFWNR